MPLPVHPGGIPWARAAGALNKSKKQSREQRREGETTGQFCAKRIMSLLFGMNHLTVERCHSVRDVGLKYS